MYILLRKQKKGGNKIKKLAKRDRERKKGNKPFEFKEVDGRRGNEEEEEERGKRKKK